MKSLPFLIIYVQVIFGEDSTLYKFETTYPKGDYPQCLNVYYGRSPFKVGKADFPRYMAKVVHSQHAEYPHMCTAVCIQPSIFISSAECVMTLRMNYTSVIYKGQQLLPRALVWPAQLSQQAFDDIGIIITTYHPGIGTWHTIKVWDVDRASKTDFSWLYHGYKAMNESHYYTVLGFVTKAEYRDRRQPTEVYELYKGIYYSSNLHYGRRYVFHRNSDTDPINTFYKVPSLSSCHYHCRKYWLARDYYCYHDFYYEAKCNQNIAARGGAVTTYGGEVLFGIVTWAIPNGPIGFAVPNSEGYRQSLACAIKLRDYGGDTVSESICDGRVRMG